MADLERREIAAVDRVHADVDHHHAAVEARLDAAVAGDGVPDHHAARADAGQHALERGQPRGLVLARHAAKPQRPVVARGERRLRLLARLHQVARDLPAHRGVDRLAAERRRLGGEPAVQEDAAVDLHERPPLAQPATVASLLRERLDALDAGRAARPRRTSRGRRPRRTAAWRPSPPRARRRGATRRTPAASRASGRSRRTCTPPGSRSAGRRAGSSPRGCRAARGRDRPPSWPRPRAASAGPSPGASRCRGR